MKNSFFFFNELLANARRLNKVMIVMIGKYFSSSSLSISLVSSLIFTSIFLLLEKDLWHFNIFFHFLCVFEFVSRYRKKRIKKNLFFLDFFLFVFFHCGILKIFFSLLYFLNKNYR